MVVRVATVAVSHDAIACCASASVGCGAVVVVVAPGAVVVVVVAAFACAASDGSGASTGSEPQLGGLADERDRLVAVLHAREVDDDVAPLAGDLRLEGAEGVDPVADDVDGHVEVSRLNLPTGESTTEVPPWRSRPSTGSWPPAP